MTVDQSARYIKYLYIFINFYPDRNTLYVSCSGNWLWAT